MRALSARQVRGIAPTDNGSLESMALAYMELDHRFKGERVQVAGGGLNLLKLPDAEDDTEYSPPRRGPKAPSTSLPT